jgi:ParB family transcriptional regulator, chromosome partitioning protein
MDLEISIDQIEIAAGRRAVDPAAVERLGESIAAVGLQHRITVCKRNGAYVLVAGRHRVEAFRKLGIERIPASMVDLNTLEAELYEIDENLARNELSPADRAAAVARRKAIYEKLNPSTKHGAIGGGRGKAGAGDKAERFTKATAEATGRSERAVQLDAARGETLGQETLAKIAHTTLDKGVELDALAKLSVDDRATLVDRAVAGEAVSAQVAPNAAGVVDYEEDPDEVDFLAKADAAIAAARYSGDMLYETLIEKSREVARAWQRCLIELECEWEARGE